MSMSGQKFQTVTLANRPLATSYGVGFINISDQNNKMYYSDGANWTCVGEVNQSPSILNGIGDSITAHNSYHPFDIDYSTYTGFPLWTPDTEFSAFMCVRNSVGSLFRATTAGKTGSSEPSWAATGTTADGTAVWTAYTPYVGKDATSFLTQAEKMSNGALNFDLSRGYRFPEFSLLKVLVISRGKGYQPSDRIIFSVAGAKAKLNINSQDGGIDSVTVTNHGYNVTGALTATIVTTLGSGAVLSLVHSNSGTYGVSGTTTADMVTRLPDCLAASIDIITVLGGTNDATILVNSFSDAATQYPLTIANLRQLYETNAAIGRKVIPLTITPRTGLTPPKVAFINRVNRWIRAYARKELWANPNQVDVSLADPTRYLTDGTASYSPLGGTGGTIGSVMVDGLHPSTLGAQYMAYTVVEAAKKWINIPPTPARPASFGDGYSLSYNEGGNIFEGLPWQASTAYVVGDQVSNDTAPIKVYRCTVAGTSAAATGPTTTTPSADGGVTWAYVRPAGFSVCGTGTAGTMTSVGGVTCSGSIWTGVTLARQSGTASGTIIGNVESPWSDGQTGTRQSLAFNLNGGGATEQWRILLCSQSLAVSSVNADEIANKYYTLEVEMEVSAASNMYMPFIKLFGQSNIHEVHDGFGNYSTQAAGLEIMPSNGGMLSLPNDGRMILRTQPMQFPVGYTTVNAGIYFGFNATTTATGLVKINHINLRKAYV